MAGEGELLPDGGTKVRVWLSIPPDEEGGLLRPGERVRSMSLAYLSRQIVSAIDVPVHVLSPRGQGEVIAGDWKEMAPVDLVARMWIVDPPTVAADEALGAFLPNIRPIRNADGSLVARLSVYPYGSFFGDGGYPGVISTGGLHGGALFGLMGLALGRPVSAARRDSEPIVEPAALAVWATEQANLIAALDLEPADQAKCAEIINMCGGDVGPLTIALTLEGWIPGNGLADWAADRAEVVLARPLADDVPMAIAADTLVAASNWPTLIRGSDFYEPRWPEFGIWDGVLEKVAMSTSLTPVFISKIADGWSLSLEELCERSLLSGLEHQQSAVVAVDDDGNEITDDLAHVLRRAG